MFDIELLVQSIAILHDDLGRNYHDSVKGVEFKPPVELSQICK